MRRRYTPGLCLLLAACATTSNRGAEGPLEVTARPVQVAAGQRHIGRLTLLAALELRASHPRFGGLSGLELSADGKTLVLISDRGTWLRARLHLAPDGTLRRLDHWQIHPLLDADGRPVRAPRHDAEAVARAPDGSWLVSFEWNHRIWRYPDGLSGRPEQLKSPPELIDAPGNGSLEALTVLPDGRLLLICEHFLARDGTNRGWIGKPNALKRLFYRATPDFAPTDLAVLPGTSDVLVLERAFSLLRGIRSRIRRIPARDLHPAARLQPEELAALHSPLPVDNFEGLAAWRHPSGAVLIYLVSDNNFNKLQRTLLYQLRLD